MRRILAYMSLAVAAFAFSGAVPAYAEDFYLNDTIQGLQGNQQIYVSTVQGINTNAILKAADGKDIAVVVLPEDAASTYGGASGFLQQLAPQTNHETILVVIGNDFAAGSKALGPGVAGQIANSAEGHGGDLSARIVDAVTNLASQRTETSSSTGTPPPSDPGFNPVPGIGIGLSVAVIGAVIWWVLKWRRKVTATEPPAVKFVQAPGAVRDRVREVLALRTQIKDSHLNELLTYIAQHVEEYFVDATKQSDGTYKAADDIAKYIGLLQTVVGRYIKVQNKPKYYRDSDQKKQEYARAIESCEKYMLEQVRAVNDAEEFDFAKAAATLAASDLRSIRA